LATVAGFGLDRERPAAYHAKHWKKGPMARGCGIGRHPTRCWSFTLCAGVQRGPDRLGRPLQL